MFTNQDVDYSLNAPCRCLGSVAPPQKSSAKIDADDGLGDEGGGEADIADGWGNDYDDDDLASSQANQRFLVGTAIPSVSKISDGDELVEEADEDRVNRLHLLKYHEDSHELLLESSWAHPTGEVWAMSCHPTRPDWVVTCGGGSVFASSAIEEGCGDENDDAAASSDPAAAALTQFKTTLWRIPDAGGEESGGGLGFDDEDKSASDTLEAVVSIPHGTTESASASGWEQRVSQVLWNPLLLSASSGDALYDLAETSSDDGGGNLITVGWGKDSPIMLWDISALSEVKEVWSARGGLMVPRKRSHLSALSSALPRKVSWDPHDVCNILATSGVDVVAYDMRTASSGGRLAIRSAHRHGVADVCHNPLLMGVVVTSGLDGIIKVWDIRGISGEVQSQKSARTNPPVLKVLRGGHTHFASNVRYNPFHDQLILSSGTEGNANLWRVSSCSSAPLLDMAMDEDDGDGDGAERSLYGDEGEEDETTQEVADENRDANAPSENEETSQKEMKGASSSQDIRVSRLECSDAVSRVVWSSNDPWMYMTLSCDGTVTAQFVPSKEKYRILL
ncbi:hypothetical protein THAOC_01388 [Thalassiosira oceanica]|uniref:EIPR1-like beta-propeller domain-containing protein n=1 Tax=Thalassiosira oceanica TaxID=159749 RepID=K0TIH4_THAOC|nr:hypothetical protein THAOC_01388 [Thalassiosira oceanica]|mmetsp:Transcript_22545/g.53217  ORF Transcript_22545/g.53217 Transcript_22545/m.53217 type:complete len:563 (+) Transcript_22545:104-1792(+)|eukprot:EJK76829.1 hypothetical protein THAOC_01388 [Thalassiosira oceanica]